MSGNFGVLNHNPSDLLPPPLTALSGNAQQDIQALFDYQKKLSSAYMELLQLFINEAQVGFSEFTDGTTTQYAYNDGVLTFTGDGGTTVTVGGSGITITSTAGNATYRSVGASIGSITDMAEGDTVYCTSNGGGYVSGYTYRWNGTDTWVLVGERAENTDNVGSKTATVVQNSVNTVAAGLDSDGNVQRNIVSTRITGGVSPGDTGLYLTADYLGYYHTVDGWQSYIDKNGQFYFTGDASNYIAWDGSSITVKCTGGFIGSSTDYFNISDGILQCKNSSAAEYVTVQDGIISFTSSVGGDIRLGLDIRTIAFDMAGVGSWTIYAKNGTDFPLSMGGDTNELFITFEPFNGSTLFKIDDDTSVYLIQGFDIDSCDIGQTTAGKVKASEYKSSDGTAGATANVDPTAVSTINFKDGLFVGTT